MIACADPTHPAHYEPADFAAAQDEEDVRGISSLPEQTGHARVVLLDRDGTLVIDRGYLADPAGLEFLPGAPEALRRLHDRGHRLVIISNQSGVGRGLFTPERLEEVNQRLRKMVQEAGASLAGIYCCPHRPEDECACRKPNVKLVHQAAYELHFEPSTAVVIGDRDSDIELGRRLGATTIRLLPKDSPAASMDASSSLQTVRPDYLASDLLEAAGIIETLTPVDR